MIENQDALLNSIKRNQNLVKRHVMQAAFHIGLLFSVFWENLCRIGEPKELIHYVYTQNERQKTNLK